MRKSLWVEKDPGVVQQGLTSYYRSLTKDLWLSFENTISRFTIFFFLNLSYPLSSASRELLFALLRERGCSLCYLRVDSHPFLLGINQILVVIVVERTISRIAIFCLWSLDCHWYSHLSRETLSVVPLYTLCKELCTELARLWAVIVSGVKLKENSWTSFAKNSKNYPRDLEYHGKRWALEIVVHESNIFPFPIYLRSFVEIGG